MLEIKNEAGRREILLHSEIGAEFGVTSKTFAESLALMGEGPVTVGINSRGGNIVEGLGIYHLLKDRPGVTTRCDGVAASIASVIFCAGEHRVMPAASYVMVHRPTVKVEGDADEIEKTAGEVRQMQATLEGIYGSVCKKSPEEISYAVNKRRWIGAAEALEWGFATEISGASLAENKLAEMLSGFGDLPEPLRRKQQENNMEMEKIQSELAAAKEQVTKLEAELKNAGETIAAKDKVIADAVAKEAKAFAATAVAEGRIKAEASDKWAALYVKDAAEAVALLPDPVKKEQKTSPPIPVTRAQNTSSAEVLAQFNAMPAGPERAAFYAANRAVIWG